MLCSTVNWLLAMRHALSCGCNFSEDQPKLDGLDEQIMSWRRFFFMLIIMSLAGEPAGAAHAKDREGGALGSRTAGAIPPLSAQRSLWILEAVPGERLAVQWEHLESLRKVVGVGQALLTLAEKAECDVRSCLNTLQFLAKRGGRITVSTINDLNVGQKDTTKGAFVVWKQLLSSRARS